MPTRFPLRERFDDGCGIDWDDVCICGHDWSDHEIGILATMKQMVGLGNSHGVDQCRKCVCPHYKLDKENLSERRKQTTKVTEGQ